MMATDWSVTRGLHVLGELEADLDLRAVEGDGLHRAHFHAGHAHGRAGLEARDVREPRPERVALPEEPALAAQQEHHDGRGDDG
jgi:hypothetical protein